MTSVQVVLYADKLMRFSKGNKFVHLFLSPPLVSADGHLPVRFHFFSLLLLVSANSRQAAQVMLFTGDDNLWSESCCYASWCYLFPLTHICLFLYDYWYESWTVIKKKKPQTFFKTVFNSKGWFNICYVDILANTAKTLQSLNIPQSITFTMSAFTLWLRSLCSGCGGRL